jgi:hypothetical protein
MVRWFPDKAIPRKGVNEAALCAIDPESAILIDCLTE